jgi:hypothetical protein
MKYLKEYSDEEIRDMVTDLKSVGHSDWMGCYITYKVYGDAGVGASVIAVVGDSLAKLAGMILGGFGIEDPKDWDIDIYTLKSIEDIMQSVDNAYGYNLGSAWEDFKFKIWDMTPKKLENSIEVVDLLDTGDVLEVGRRYFSDFDSKILQPGH